MPESQKPRSGQQLGKSKAGNVPRTQGQQQVQEEQEYDPAVLDAYFNEDVDADADDDADADGNQIGSLGQLARQLSFVLIPFLFAIVTFLLAFLLLLARGPALHSLPLTELWAIGLIALAMAVLQGMMLYYSGSNGELWFLSVLVGFILFPPVLFFALAGAAASLVTLVIMLVICIAIVWLCRAPVPEGHVSIVYSFGKYLRTLSPGLHFLPPWERITRTFDTSEKEWSCPPQTVRMSPSEDLSLAGTIAYEINPEDAHVTALYANKWEKQLHERFRAALQNIATEFKPEDFYPWQQGAGNSPDPNAGNNIDAGSPKEKTPTWGRMNSRLLQMMRDQAAPFGVQVNLVTIHDVIPLPHVEHVESAGIGTGAVRGAGTAETTASTTVNAATSARPGTSRPAFTSAQRQTSAAGARVSQPPPAAPAAPTPAATVTDKRFDAIIKPYDAVRSGVITDPETIRRIAKHFEAIAQDPAMSQNFPFDAARAANNLYARAKYYEDQISASAEYPYNDEYDDDVDMGGHLSGETQPDWLHQPPPDDDLTGGG